MNEILKVTTNEQQEPCISGRELHKFLEVETPYHIWFPRMVGYGFDEDIDFSTFEQKCSKPQGGRPSTDHIIKLDMAKELAMIQRSEKGKQARQYFIEIEKEYNSPEKIMARALLMADKQIKELTIRNSEQKQLIEEQQPKVLFAQSVESSNNSCLVGELAKILRQNGIHIGQNRLFSWLRENGYLGRKGEFYNTPTQKSMDLGLMTIKKNVINQPDGTIRTTTTTKISGKGQIYFINKFLGEAV